MLDWLQRFTTRRKARLHALPLGDSGRELPWHTTRAEAKRLLAAVGALSLEVDGNPTARLKFGDLTLRATLEFEDGLRVKRMWLPKVPGADLRTDTGKAVPAVPHLRAVTLQFPERDPRGNWRWTLAQLGKPEARAPDGSWEWRSPQSVARYFEATDGDDPERIRLETTQSARLLEIVNRSAFELYRSLAVAVTFAGATWETSEEPPTQGVLTRLVWFVPEGESMTVSARWDGREVSAKVFARARQVIITADGDGGVRIVS